MMWASPTCHPGGARMMVALRPCHGFAMMWASPTRHPGEARMMVALRPCHGFAMMWASPTRHPGFARMIKEIYLREKGNFHFDIYLGVDCKKALARLKVTYIIIIYKLKIFRK
jgi:hypothetical protein